LVAVCRDRVLKVSVKGSQDGSWGLTQAFIKNANYHGAADLWFAKHSRKTVFCFVQLKDCSVDILPRMYLATPMEVTEWLKKAAKGRGDGILYEQHDLGAKGARCGNDGCDSCPMEVHRKATAGDSREDGEMSRKDVCPKCGSKDVIPIVFGYPTVETGETAERCELALGGSCVGDNDPDCACRTCGHQWRESK